MVIVDANVLLYAVNRTAPNHSPARRWIEEALNSDEALGFSWTVLLAFLRIATMPALSPTPLETTQALDVIDSWLGAPPAMVVQAGPRHAGLLRGLLSGAGTAGNLVGDGHLAALALEHSARICSFDRDFARFPGVNSFRPTD
ncbi:MAG: TA system VapC family ribonuclease toxin [Candidatus Dormibacteria bacterium]